jgi:tetraacyldisaccharide 4'-kinase
MWWARWPYAMGVWGRNKLFDWGWKSIHRVSVPVVSVGNLTVGGTGKTPCVEYVARFLRQHERRVAILSRGYKAREGGTGRNDEAMLLEENLPDVPHLQDPDRVAIAQTAIDELESEVLVLDDGFQHRRLARDLDIVLIDATNPWGHGYLLPRGGLREPIGGLRRAHAVVITRADRVSPAQLQAIRDHITRLTDAPVSSTIHQPLELMGAEGRSEHLEAIHDRPVGGFCGIGNPDAFRETLKCLGADVREFRSFADHHGYTREDVDGLRRWAEKLPREAVVMTTQKDYVKLRIADLADRPLWAVRIGLRYLEGEEAFQEKLKSLVSTL